MKKVPPKIVKNNSALNLVEESLFTLRHSPFEITGLYYIGTLPFILGLLYFWTEMSSSYKAERILPDQSIIITILFIWMKFFQTLFMNKMLNKIKGISKETFSIKRLLKILTHQTIIQSTGLIIMPLTMLILIPFGHVHAFYYNFSLLGNGKDENLKTSIFKSWEQTHVNPHQNWLLIWLSSPWFLTLTTVLIFLILPVLSQYLIEFSNIIALLVFVIFILFLILSPIGLILIINIAFLFYGIPVMLKILFNIDTVFTISNDSILNSTFMITIFAVAFLIMDPLIKTAYTIRCFYGYSIKTGSDLLVELKQQIKINKTIAFSVFILTSLLFSPSLSAKEIDSSELNSTIENVLNQPEYSWRMPKEKVVEVEQEEKGIIGSFLEAVFNFIKKVSKIIGKWLGKLIDWFNDNISSLFKNDNKIKKESNDWKTIVTVILIIFIVLVVLILLFLIYKMYKKPKKEIKGVKAVAKIKPDLNDENIDASILPEDEWKKLAKKMIAEGKLKLAVRAMYLSGLSSLGKNGILSLNSFKSNLDYKYELLQRVKKSSELALIFNCNTLVFEMIWYGEHNVSNEILDEFSKNLERIKVCAQA